MQDKEITCRNAGSDEHAEYCVGKFIWTVGEQEFFAERGFSEPNKCKPCRDARKAQGRNNNRQFEDRAA